MLNRSLRRARRQARHRAMLPSTGSLSSIWLSCHMYDGCYCQTARPRACSAWSMVLHGADTPLFAHGKLRRGVYRHCGCAPGRLSASCAQTTFKDQPPVLLGILRSDGSASAVAVGHTTAHSPCTADSTRATLSRGPTTGNGERVPTSRVRSKYQTRVYRVYRVLWTGRTGISQHARLARVI